MFYHKHAKYVEPSKVPTFTIILSPFPFFHGEDVQPLITRKDLGSWIKFLRCDHELIKELERLSARFIYRLD